MTGATKELKKPNDLFDWLAKNYPNQPIIQALFAFVVGAASSTTDSPLIGGLANTTIPLIVYGVEQLLAERRKVFFDELAKGKLDLTEELIKQEKFLHAFFTVYNASIKTLQRDKIKMFARLLITGVKEDSLGSSEFEEFAQILEDLTPRELEILLVLERFQNLYPRQLVENKGSRQLENGYQYTNRFWDAFRIAVENECGIQHDKLISILTGLARTGFYEPVTGTFWGYPGGRGLLTPRFSEFTRWIELEANEA